MVHRDNRSGIRTNGDDTVLIRIKYIGQTGKASATSTVAKISLTSGGVMQLFVSNTKDSTVTGGAAFTNGKILLTNAAFDTVKEFCNALKSLSSNLWDAWPVDALPGDPMSNIVKYRSDLQADRSLLWRDEGLPIYLDVSKVKKVQKGISFKGGANQLRDYEAKTRGIVDKIHVFFDKSNNSNTALAMKLDIIQCDDSLGSTRVIWSQQFNSTATNKTRQYDVDLGGQITGDYGHRLVCRLSGYKRISTGSVLTTMSVIGAVESHPQVGRFKKGYRGNLVNN